MGGARTCLPCPVRDRHPRGYAPLGLDIDADVAPLEERGLQHVGNWHLLHIRLGCQQGHYQEEGGGGSEGAAEGMTCLHEDNSKVCAGAHGIVDWNARVAELEVGTAIKVRDVMAKGRKLAIGLAQSRAQARAFDGAL